MLEVLEISKLLNVVMFLRTNWWILMDIPWIHVFISWWIRPVNVKPMGGPFPVAACNNPRSYCTLWPYCMLWGSCDLREIQNGDGAEVNKHWEVNICCRSKQTLTAKLFYIKNPWNKHRASLVMLQPYCTRPAASVQYGSRTTRAITSDSVTLACSSVYVLLF